METNTDDLRVCELLSHPLHPHSSPISKEKCHHHIIDEATEVTKEMTHPLTIPEKIRGRAGLLNVIASHSSMQPLSKESGLHRIG